MHILHISMNHVLNVWGISLPTYPGLNFLKPYYGKYLGEMHPKQRKSLYYAPIIQQEKTLKNVVFSRVFVFMLLSRIELLTSSLPRMRSAD